MSRRLTDLFPLWALSLSGVAFVWPLPFAHLRPAITPLLGVVMLGMGLTLTMQSFALVLGRPKVVLAGTSLQFVLMPAVAWGVASALGLSSELVAGVVLVGACPGGTASNVIAYLAKGDVALSVTLTSVSTVLATLLTPALSWLYLQTVVDVPALVMLQSVAKIVLFPVLAGALVNTYFGSRLDRVRPFFPLLSVLAIVVIIAIIVGLTRDTIASAGPVVLVAVAVHNAVGLCGGYLAGRLLGFSRKECRTLGIEVGMQNSGLAVALSSKYFSATAALPGAIFSIWHNLSGSALAAWWSKQNIDPADDPTTRD